MPLEGERASNLEREALLRGLSVRTYKIGRELAEALIGKFRGRKKLELVREYLEVEESPIVAILRRPEYPYPALLAIYLPTTNSLIDLALLFPLDLFKDMLYREGVSKYSIARLLRTLSRLGLILNVEGERMVALPIDADLLSLVLKRAKLSEDEECRVKYLAWTRGLELIPSRHSLPVMYWLFQ